MRPRGAGAINRQPSELGWATSDVLSQASTSVPGVGGAPPGGRDGAPASNVGRPVMAGVGPKERVLSTRTTPYELWAALRILKSPDVGLSRLRALHGSAIDNAAFRRISAYLTQAEAYYLSADAMSPESRPLVAYYFVLNLTKALLTCLQPSLTSSGRVLHGLSDAYERKQRYWFNQEQAKVSGSRAGSTSAFRELALRTGGRFCYPPGDVLAIHKLAPYLSETADLFEEATAVPPKLVPIERIEVWTGGGRTWLRTEVDRAELARRGLGPASLPSRARHFGSIFKHVNTPEPTVSYESKEAWPYGGKQILLRFPELSNAFERSLIHLNRGTTGSRHLAIISERERLLSQEAVCFLVMHHLSNMVRYRPESVEKLGTQRWFFLFTLWVPRAMENFLLAVTSRILKEETRIG